MRALDGIRRTLAGPGEARTEARRSRFFAHAAPLPDDGPALRAWLEGIRARHHAARHVVYGWRGERGRSRGSDDGEPHGTGARPCLQALEGLGLEGAGVAVARIFGGVLLGAANLARAYGDAAAAALGAAAARELHAGRAFLATVPHGEAAAVERALGALGAQDIGRSAGAGGLELRGWIPSGAAGRLTGAVAAASRGAGRVRLADGERWR